MKETKSTGIDSLHTVNNGDDNKIAIASSSSGDKSETKQETGEDMEQKIEITRETESLLVERKGSVYRATKAQKR